MQSQSDDVLRNHPEYSKGVKDFNAGKYNPRDYPLISNSGLFLKKAYQLGWYDRKKEQAERKV